MLDVVPQRNCKILIISEEQKKLERIPRKGDLLLLSKD